MADLYIKEQTQDKRNGIELQYSFTARSLWNSTESCVYNMKIISGTSLFLSSGKDKGV